MASATENTPLIPTIQAQVQTGGHAAATPAAKPQRNVTFNPQTTVASSIGPLSSSLRSPTHTAPLRPPHNSVTGQPMLSALNSKLRRRNSQVPAAVPPMNPVSKIGPQRTTKTAQKLKLLPNPDPGDNSPDEESGRDVYSQFTRIKDPTARRDAARLGKADRDRIPRVTAYCTAGAYRLDGLMKFLKGRAKLRGTAPKLFDECIYSPYKYAKLVDGKSNNHSDFRDRHPPIQRRHSDSSVETREFSDHQRGDLIDFHGEGAGGLGNSEHEIPEATSPELEHLDQQISTDLDTDVHTPEVFLFNYGTVVIWGMSLHHEQRFLKEIAKFESEKLSKDDVQTENFNFYYTKDYQARIYNDFISLREKKNYMTKLAISHALAQSVKTSLFEDLVDNTIEATKDLPETIALTGKVNLTRREINMQIGELFILRINIHLQGSVLDSPELMWAEPQLDPVYQAVRSYLEMDQRVGLLTERLNVIADLLAVLKDQLTHTHGEYLEWI
ncbi:hypothetical protein GP486_005601, partial [Trichoglossum hirsutum]